MTRTKLVTLATAGAIAAGTFGFAGTASARDNRTDEAAVMANAKISMTQAIAAAEQQTGGKAVGTGIEDQDGTVFLEVQVLKNGQRQKVLIDPQNGQVVKTVMRDDDEHENGRENDDD